MNSFFNSLWVQHLWGVYVTSQMVASFVRGDFWLGVFYAVLVVMHLWIMWRRQERLRNAK